MGSRAHSMERAVHKHLEWIGDCRKNIQTLERTQIQKYDASWHYVYSEGKQSLGHYATPSTATPRTTEEPLSEKPESQCHTVEEGEAEGLLFIPIVLLLLAILKVWRLWLEAQGPSTSLPAGVPATPSDQSQTARGFGYPDGPL